MAPVLRQRLMRLLGPPTKPLMYRYWQLSRGMTLGVRCAAISKDNQVYLVKHTYTPGWHLPGGGVDHGETIFQAGERELLEETGLAVDAPLELFGFYANMNSSKRDHVALFVCRDWHVAFERQPDQEIAEIGSFDVRNLPVDVTRATRRRLDEVFDGAPISPEW